MTQPPPGAAPLGAVCRYLDLKTSPGTLDCRLDFGRITESEATANRRPESHNSFALGVVLTGQCADLDQVVAQDAHSAAGSTR